MNVGKCWGPVLSSVVRNVPSCAASSVLSWFVRAILPAIIRTVRTTSVSSVRTCVVWHVLPTSVRNILTFLAIAAVQQRAYLKQKRRKENVTLSSAIKIHHWSIETRQFNIPPRFVTLWMINSMSSSRTHLRTGSDSHFLFLQKKKISSLNEIETDASTSFKNLKFIWNLFLLQDNTTSMNKIEIRNVGRSSDAQLS